VPFGFFDIYNITYQKRKKKKKGLFVNDHMIMFWRVKSAMVIKVDDKGGVGAGAQASASIRRSLSSKLCSSCRNWGQRRFQQQGILIGAPG
jgi:hypothetical protein